eukprot:6448352-Prymnesium_polylepis.1
MSLDERAQHDLRRERRFSSERRATICRCLFVLQIRRHKSPADLWLIGSRAFIAPWGLLRTAHGLWCAGRRYSSATRLCGASGRSGRCR